MIGPTVQRRHVAAVAWAATAVVGVRGVTGLVNTWCSLAWLRVGVGSGVEHREAGVPHFVLIVPLLREQRVIGETIGYFAELAARRESTSIVLVTTEREEREPAAGGGIATTSELAGKLAARAARAGLPVLHVHYPDPGGVMVHQVNYAAQVCLGQLQGQGIDARRVWLAVYNADSRPEQRTLDAVAALAGRLRPSPRIMQQSAVFTTSLGSLPSGPMGALAGGAALLQSRWTLAREIPRLRRQARQARRGRRRVRWPRLAHCVGHGLFIRGDEFLRWGGLPTATMNEDLTFGYFLCADRMPIDPLPLLERGDSPSSVWGTIRQSRQWFWSYVDYPLSTRLAANDGIGTGLGRGWLLAQGLVRGVLWLGLSPALVATVALPALSRRRGRAVAAATAAVMAYSVVPVALLARAERAAGEALRFGPREAMGLVGAGFLSSVGPWWCVASAARRRVTGATYVHDKTER